MGLARQPSASQAGRAAFDAGQYTVVPRDERLDRVCGNLSFAVGEESAQIPVARRPDNDALAENRRAGCADPARTAQASPSGDPWVVEADPSVAIGIRLRRVRDENARHVRFGARPQAAADG